MNAATTLKKFGLEQAFHYIYKDPDKNMLKIMDWADKFAGNNFVSQRTMIREAITTRNTLITLTCAVYSGISTSAYSCITPIPSSGKKRFWKHCALLC